MALKKIIIFNVISMVALLEAGTHSSAVTTFARKVYDLDPKAQAGVAIGLAALSSYAAETLSEKAMVKTMAHHCGVDTKDACKVVSIASGLYGLSMLTEKHIGEGLRSMAKRVPLAAAVIRATTSETFGSVAQHIPVVGKSFVCKETGCTGLCKRCVLSKGVLGIGTYTMLDAVLTKAFNYWLHS